MTLRQVLANNWFYPVTAALLLAAWLCFRIPLLSPDGEQVAPAEAALIFDAFVSLLLLYWLCFRRQQSVKANIIGMIAVACCALWFAGWIVPHELQALIPRLNWLRPVILVGLGVIEIRLAIGVLKLVFKASAEGQDLQKAGVPPIMARIMLCEARFWRWVISKFRK